ncbi:KDO2-lipid IV(A) lauroyltransferase [Loktanella fryxellensis]|uniref:KDO2-lipid IV(A) lauroyltransferase n=1 Tax=Loktanella fryxellensis TaxID=245187 RepID=A0A1H7YI02_9RHOB|nr:lauroyl acyltransferase [Loktanella fryxellensis]SEM44927.1 KDO2-lipid IV(A) lauroyltransferase [Loktanella fryxellensis]
MARTDTPADDDTPSGTRAEWWQDRVLRGVIGGLNRLPYARRMALMGGLTARVIGPLAGYHRRAREQLALIYPDMAPAARHALATRVCDNFGRTLLENYANRDFAAQLADVRPTGDGLAPLAQARADGRPVIFVTGHFGNFEAPRHVLTRDGAVIGGLYRPMANAYVDSHYRETMTRWGGPVFPQGSRGTMGFARHIKGGGMGTLLFDVHVFRATPIDFLGRPALTSLAAADMALRFDALLIPYFGTRRPDGLSFDVAVEAPIPHSDPVTMMTEASRRLAARIATHPEQWFWVHRRWR